MLLEWLKGSSTRGFRRSLRVARHELKMQRAHKASVRRAKKFHPLIGLKLNIGCGKNLKPGWINIDRVAEAEFQLDMREDLPFRDGSVSHILTEHFFEHLEYPKEACRFLRECFRVLKNGGILDVSVPDTEWPVRSYATNDDSYFQIAREQFHPKWCDTKMHHLNFHFRQGEEHKYAYDEETLAKILQKSGFTEIRRRNFDSTLDSKEREIGTLYLRARRSGGRI